MAFCIFCSNFIIYFYITYNVISYKVIRYIYYMITLTLTQLCIFVLVLIFLAGIPAFVYLNYSENERLKANNTVETERLLMNAIQLAVETEIKLNRV